jgi:hypothetical protein
LLYRFRRENEVDMGVVGGRSPLTTPISFLHPAESGRTFFICQLLPAAGKEIALLRRSEVLEGNSTNLVFFLTEV